MALLRFFRNGVIVGTVENQDEVPVLELAEDGRIDIPRNCTSGNCGTCMVNLLSGKLPMPDPLPPGLDDDMVELGNVLTCIGIAKGACDFELNAPL